jgi:hypothetical protein
MQTRWIGWWDKYLIILMLGLYEVVDQIQANQMKPWTKFSNPISTKVKIKYWLSFCKFCNYYWLFINLMKTYFIKFEYNIRDGQVTEGTQWFSANLHLLPDRLLDQCLSFLPGISPWILLPTPTICFSSFLVSSWIKYHET